MSDEITLSVSAKWDDGDIPSLTRSASNVKIDQASGERSGDVLRINTTSTQLLVDEDVTNGGLCWFFNGGTQDVTITGVDILVKPGEPAILRAANNASMFVSAAANATSNAFEYLVTSA